MESLILSKLTSAAIVVYGLQLLKEGEWFPWLTTKTQTINRLAALVLAAVSAIGVHWAWDSTSGTLTLTGLTMASVMHGAWDFANQFAAQQLMFDGIVSTRTNGRTA